RRWIVARRRWLIGAAILAAGALAAFAGLNACLRQPPEPLRIGVNAWPPFELLYLAREKGFLRDAGADVELVDFSSYTGVLRSYHQGNIDGFFATLNEVLIAENFQDLPAVVLVADYSYGGDALIVNDGITDLRQLKGKAIAYEQSGLGSYVLERVLDKAGLQPGDVRAENRLPEEGRRAFQNREVDALITYEPDVGRLVRERGARVLFSSRDIPGEIVDVLAMRRAATATRADEIGRMLKAWFRAAEYDRAHPDEAAALMARRQNVTVQEFLQGLNGAHVPDLAENKVLLGPATRRGSLHQAAERLGSFLLKHGLTRRVATGAELFYPRIIESL
ncbi:MAG TPA: ABC transporter substrate-binding protein, partial [Candidatus Polarisedimenticolia bacterium]|nr:ABC transporter substrate-binding protein [Candidatus Polarisedimenticolia bacterium]